MPLETGTYINDFVNTNPPNSDPESQGAGHLRLIKSILQNSFPGSNRGWVIPTSTVKTANYTVVTGDQNSCILINTGTGSFTMTLPTLGAGDAGWQVEFMKSNTGVNPYFIAPPSGTLQSGELTGLTSTRRAIPGRRTRVLWTGSVWICDRVLGQVVGSLVLYHGSTLPVGYEWPNGQTLSSSANYPDYFAQNGSSLVTPDMRGRAIFGLDNMGGSAAGRITVAGGNFDGTVLDNSGGLQNHLLLSGEMPSHQHNVYLKDPGHTHTYTATNSGFATASPPGAPVGQTTLNTGSSTTGITIGSVNGVANDNLTASTGGGAAHTVLNPAIVEGVLLVVE